MSSMKYFEAARKFLDSLENAPLRFWNHKYWEYVGTHYRCIGDTDHVQLEVLRYLRRNAIADSSRWARETELNLRAICAVPTWQAMPAEVGSSQQGRFVISLSNGLLDLEPCLTGDAPLLNDHNEEWFNIVHLPFPYDEDAECPRWVAFLHEVMEGDQERIDLLQEWFGYCCLPDTGFEKAMLWEGRGRNGKSQAMRVLINLVGRDNISAVPLEKLHHRFRLANTVGKLLNVATETAPNAKVDDALLKQYISGEEVETEYKRKDLFTFQPTARLLVSMNERASIRDYSDGIWRRLLVVPWKYQVPEDKVVVGLGDLIAQEELPGILRWAIQGVTRLYQKGGFTQGAEATKALAHFRDERDPARGAILTCFRADPDGFTSSNHLWNAYRQYCFDRDLPVTIESTPILIKAIRRYFPDIESERRNLEDGTRVRGWAGIELVESEEPSEFTNLSHEAGCRSDPASVR